MKTLAYLLTAFCSAGIAAIAFLAFYLAATVTMAAMAFPPLWFLGVPCLMMLAMVSVVAVIELPDFFRECLSVA